MAGNNAARFERGVDTNRRRFLGGTALAAVGAIIGDVVPLSGALAQGAAPATPAAPAAPKGPQYLKFPGKNEKLVVLGDRPLVAETPESLLDDDTTPTEKFFVRNNGRLRRKPRTPTSGRSPSTAR
jgi:sulfite oxidase